jgi:fibronectin type 3 domain-containing protein
MSKYESTATIKYNVTPTVKGSNTANGVKVTWSTATNATGYRVYRSTLSNGKWSGWKNMGTAKANKTAWTDKTVKTGVTYKYTVRAVYNNTLSSYNKTGAAVLFLATPTVKIANASNGIKVSWNKISGATSYYVY